MHHCDDIKKHLWAFLMKETDPQTSQKIQTHLQGCPSCQKECEALQKLQGAMQMDISSSMPEDFADTLHAKLMVAAEEMTAPTFGERFLESLRRFRQYGAFKTLAPALVCLVFVIGVFSSGIYENWQRENPILNPAPTAVPTVTPTAVSTSNPVTEPIPTQKPNVISVPATTPAPEVTTPVGTEAPAILAEDIPAPASIEGEPQIAAYILPERQMDICQISVSDPVSFLDGWQENWQQYRQELSGLDGSSIFLELPQTAFQSFKTYAEEHGINTENLSQEENQDKTLVLITGNEE